MDRSQLKLKAAVLLEELDFIQNHIEDPGKYFPPLTNKRILCKDQWSKIRSEPCVERQVRKLIELICLKEGGYDAFLQALRNQKVHANVARHLKGKLSEVEKLNIQGQLPPDLLEHLTLFDFISETQNSIDHDTAWDILNGKNWNLKGALLAAKEMGHRLSTDISEDPLLDAPNEENGLLDAPISPVPCNPRPRNRLSSGYPLDLIPLGAQSNSSSSSSILSSGSHNTSQGSSAECEPAMPDDRIPSFVAKKARNGSRIDLECGLLPPSPAPTENLTSHLPESNQDNEIHPEHGILPIQPPHSSQRVCPLTTPIRSSTPDCSPSPVKATMPSLSSPTKQVAHSSPLITQPSLPSAKPSGAPVWSSSALQLNFSYPPPSQSSNKPVDHSPSRNLPIIVPPVRSSSTLQLNSAKTPPFSKPVDSLPSSTRSNMPSATSLVRERPDLDLQLSSPPHHSKAAPRSTALSSKQDSGTQVSPSSPGDARLQPSAESTDSVYLMNMTDEKAIDLMSDVKKPGVFFIRASEKEGAPYTLCVTDKSNLLKYHIRSSGRSYYIHKDLVFSSLDELVEYYKKHSIKSNGKLTIPLAQYKSARNWISGLVKKLPSIKDSGKKPSSHDNKVSFGDKEGASIAVNILTPQEDGRALDSFWTCYHCNEYNTNDIHSCSNCEMLWIYTEKSWKVENPVKREVENYQCVSCETFIRLPFTPCPLKLVNQLGRLKLCYKCYRRRKNTPPMTPKTPKTPSSDGLSIDNGGLRIDQGTQTESGSEESKQLPAQSPSQLPQRPAPQAPPTAAELPQQPPVRPVPPPTSRSIAERPTMLKLLSMPYNGKELRIIYEVSPYWEQVGIALALDSTFIKILQKDHSSDALSACTKMFQNLVDERKCSTWKELIDGLSRADMKKLAKDIESALQSSSL